MRRPEFRTLPVGMSIAAITVLIILAVGGNQYRAGVRLRHERIEANRAEIARLRWLVTHERDLATAVRKHDVSGSNQSLLLRGRTPAIAGASLQTFLQRDAEENAVAINRLDVAGSVDSAPPVPAIPASLSAVADIYGIAGFLSALRNGPPVVAISGMTIVSSSALKDNLLQLSATITAPFIQQ